MPPLRPPGVDPKARAVTTGVPAGLRAMTILWPAFLMAGVLEMLVFALVDPGSRHWFGGAPMEWPASAIYTLALFAFWAVIASASALTQWPDQSAAEVNQGKLRGSAPNWPR